MWRYDLRQARIGQAYSMFESSKYFINKIVY